MKLELKRVVLEAVAVAAFGLAFALVANQISPRGLSLARDYFPGPRKAASNSSPGHAAQANNNGASVPGGEPGRVSATSTATATVTVKDPVSARLIAQGLQPVDGKAAQELFRDPQFEQDLIVFIDARNDQHYQEGHIPGAYQFDRYYPEKYLPAVLPVCLNASKVVVYCTGGNCEDSEFAALALKDAGVAPDRLFVYAGGITEWATNGLHQIEVGGRKSGTLKR